MSSVRVSRSRSELERLVRERDFVVVAFTGITCPACQLYRPVLEEFSRLAEEVLVVEHVVDYDPDPAIELGILGTPATVVYIRGEPVEGFVGAVDLPDLVEFLARVASEHRIERVARLLSELSSRVEPVLGF